MDSSDAYRHSKWLSFMEKRLKLAKKLLNPKDSVLIITIDEKEYLHLGCLLEKIFSEARIQMITTVISAKGVVRTGQFSRVEEYIYILELGNSSVQPGIYNMLEDEVKKEPDRTIEWLGFRRRAPQAKRNSRPNQFYPIFVSNSDGRIVSIGDVVKHGVDRNTILVPDGCTALWPLSKDGDERLLIDTYSAYFKNKMLSQPDNSPDSFAIFITEKQFSDLSNDIADRVLCLDCGEFQLNEYVPLRSSFVVKMLDNVVFITFLMIKYNEYLERFKVYAKLSVANTAALLMAISEISLIDLEKSWRTKLMTELEEYIMQALDGSVADASAAFVDYLCTKRDFPVVTKEQFDDSQEQLLVIDDDVYFARQTMQHIAKQLRMGTKLLCDTLKNKNLLQAESGFQKAVNVNGRTFRMYKLRQRDIFPTGDIRFEIDGFSNAEPQLRLNLGKNNTSSVYYAVNALDGSENGHAMITGNTRTGKSTFLTNVARQANRAGIKVVCIGTTYSRLALSGDEVSVHQYFDEPLTYLLSDLLSGINKEYLIDEERNWLEMIMEEAENGKQYSSLAECEHEILSMIDINECSMLIKQVKNIIESEAKRVDWNDVFISTTL